MTRVAVRYTWISALVILMVVLLPFLSQCGRQHHDNPLENPVQTQDTLASIAYTLNDPNRQTPSEGRISIHPQEQDLLLSLFNGSQVDPQPLRWQTAGTIELIDTRGNKVDIRLFSTTPDLPDAYRIDGVYYRKAGLLESLNAWIAEHQPVEEPTDAPEATHR